MRIVAVASFAVAAFVSSSAGAQPAAPPPPAPAAPSQLELPPIPTVSDPKLEPLPQAARVIKSWQEAAATARNRSTDLRILRADVERARGASRVALAGALPTATGSASVTRTLYDSRRGEAQPPATLPLPGGGAGTAPQGDGSPWSWQAGVVVTQPLLALREWYAIGTARREERVATLSSEDQERLVLGAVADALVAVIVAERVAELNRAGLRSSLETLELTLTRERLGAATLLDVVRVRQDAAVARSAVVTGDESVRQAREALGAALGYGEPWGVAPGFDLAALEAGLRGDCAPVDEARDRADLLAARGAVEIAERRVTDVDLQYAPSVDLGTRFGVEGRDGFHGGPEASWTVSGNLTVPIWDGGARYGSRRIARAGVDEAEQRLLAVERGASVEVSRARRGVDVAEEVRTVQSEARDLAVETDRLARLGFAAGRGTSLDLVQAAQLRRQAESQLALREFSVVGARVTAILASSRCRPR